MIVDMYTIGKICFRFRQSLGVTQSYVAMKLGYSTETISQFERGLNDNYRILLWYMGEGLTYDKIKQEVIRCNSSIRP